MELNWSLKEIYPSFDSDEFKQDLNKLTDIIEEINKWALEATKNKDNLVEKLEDYINNLQK